MRSTRPFFPALASVFLLALTVAWAEPRPCPPDLDPKTEQKTVACPRFKDSTVDRAADVREYEDPDGRYSDTYLYCDGNLQLNVFGGSLSRAICWVTRGPEAVVWYKPVPGPWNQNNKGGNPR